MFSPPIDSEAYVENVVKWGYLYFNSRPIFDTHWYIFQIYAMIGNGDFLDDQGQVFDDESEADVVTRTFVSIPTW